MRAFFTSTVALVLLAAPAAAQQAPDASLERARALFEQGRVAYEAGDFETALARFREAHELTGNADILYNVASSADRLRRDDVALEAYRGYLDARPDSTDRAQVEGRIRVLETQIARREEERRQQEADRRALAAQLEARSVEPAEGGPAGRGAGPAPWIVAGVGAATLVAGVVTLVVAELDAACVEDPSGCVEQPDAPRWSEVEARYDRVPALRGVGGALTGIGAAAVAVGLAWGLAAGGSTDAGGDTASTTVALGPGGVIVRGVF
jgi:tetratricopeptide (TPR) repeat protein